MTAIRITAPAKVNLLLLVGPVQPDGYHPLLSVMAPIDVADELVCDLRAYPPHMGASSASAGGVTVTCPGVPAGENLVDRAVAVIERESGWRLEGRIDICKRIPAAAGLGGGSSDAAAALLMGAKVVAEAGGPDLGPERLAVAALGLGADVPFFLQPGVKLARGRGERLEPLSLPRLELVLIRPEEALSTREVYAVYDTVAGDESETEFADRCALAAEAWRNLERAWLEGLLDQETAAARVGPLARNDLERAAYRVVTDLYARKVALEATGARAAMMTGSGPAMLGVYTSRASAERAAEELASYGYDVEVTGTEGMDGGPRRTLP